MPEDLHLDIHETALVLIDLQNGIVGRDLQPHSGQDVLQRGKVLASRFREIGQPVVLVRVSFSADGGDMPSQRVDEPLPVPAGGFPAGWDQLADGLAAPGDILVVKRHWGALYGTELDLQLRRRGIRTVVLGGIATNLGVESTARALWEHGYHVVLAEDATTSLSDEMHRFAVTAILPRLARVRRCAAIAAALG